MFMNEELVYHIIDDKVPRNYGEWSDLYEDFTNKFLTSKFVMFGLIILFILSLILNISLLVNTISIFKKKWQSKTNKRNAIIQLILSFTITIIIICFLVTYYYNSNLLNKLNKAIPKHNTYI